MIPIEWIYVKLIVLLIVSQLPSKYEFMTVSVELMVLNLNLVLSRYLHGTLLYESVDHLDDFSMDIFNHAVLCPNLYLESFDTCLLCLVMFNFPPKNCLSISVGVYFHRFDNGVCHVQSI